MFAAVIGNKVELPMLEALYFAFQNFTTIGFGDIRLRDTIDNMTFKKYIPAEMMSMIGMSLVATVINSIFLHQTNDSAASNQDPTVDLDEKLI